MNNKLATQQLPQLSVPFILHYFGCLSQPDDGKPPFIQLQINVLNESHHAYPLSTGPFVSGWPSLLSPWSPCPASPPQRWPALVLIQTSIDPHCIPPGKIQQIVDFLLAFGSSNFLVLSYNGLWAVFGRYSDTLLACILALTPDAWRSRSLCYLPQVIPAANSVPLPHGSHMLLYSVFRCPTPAQWP